MKYCMKQ